MGLIQKKKIKLYICKLYIKKTVRSSIYTHNHFNCHTGNGVGRGHGKWEGLLKGINRHETSDSTGYVASVFKKTLDASTWTE